MKDHLNAKSISGTMDWKDAIKQWRALPEAEKLRRRWTSIPRRVAASFAFAGEPVDLAALEAEHARHEMPAARARPDPLP